MIEIKNPADCCGCTACASICNHDAILMKPDILGFLYPKVDKEKCVDCGLCEKICAFNEHYDTSLNLSKPLAYAARHKDMREVKTSRSGAAFIAISDYILESGGVVYGAGYTDHFRVVHKRATTKEERNEFKGSKYVQSDMNTVFRQVKKDLRDGLTVLFSGTPCQTSGLNSYVGRKWREKLILIDIICHAVPSPFVWRDYLTILEKKYKGKVVFVDFRDKSKGWAHIHEEKFVFDNGQSVNRGTFTHFFYSNLDIRQSCATCHYANLNRPSDITLGDFWGFEKVVPNMNTDNKGLSLMIINSENGRKLFDEIKSNLMYQEVALKDCLQPNLCHPTNVKDSKENKFIDDYEKYGVTYVACKYADWSKLYPLKCFLKKVIKKIKTK